MLIGNISRAKAKAGISATSNKLRKRRPVIVATWTSSRLALENEYKPAG